MITIINLPRLSRKALFSGCPSPFERIGVKQKGNINLTPLQVFLNMLD
jgi:hypothetical protein